MIPSPLLLAVVLPTIWIVDASNGPGANFTDLPPAVAAAAHGDTILVRPGSYSPFSVTGKALTIRGAGSASTFITSSPLLSTTINSVPTGFYLSGLTVGPGPSPAGFSTNLALVVSGSVLTIADVVVQGQPNFGFQGTSAMYVSGGSVVHAARCTFTGGVSDYTGGAGVVLFGGALVADASSFTGGSTSGTFFLVSGGPGLFLVSGYATIARSSLTGGSSFINAAEAIRATQSSFVRFSGIPSDVIVGGTSQNAPGLSASAIVADGTTTIVVHGAPSLVPGFPSVSPVNGPVTLGAPILPYLSVAGTVNAAGELVALQPVAVTFEAYLAFAPFAAIVDLVPGFSTAFSPIALGELLVPVPSAFALLGTLDAAGTAQVGMTPAVSAPALLDVPLHVQFAVLDAAAGNVRLSNEWIRIFKP